MVAVHEPHHCGRENVRWLQCMNLIIAVGRMLDGSSALNLIMAVGRMLDGCSALNLITAVGRMLDGCSA